MGIKYSVNSLLQKCDIPVIQKTMLKEIFRYTKASKLKNLLRNIDKLDTNEMIEWYLLVKSILITDIEECPVIKHKEIAEEIIKIWSTHANN